MQNIYEVQQSNKIKSGVITTLFFLFSVIAIYFISQAFGYYNGYETGGLGYVELH